MKYKFKEFLLSLGMIAGITACFFLFTNIRDNQIFTLSSGIYTALIILAVYIMSKFEKF